MLKEQKNQVFVFGIVAIMGILLATPIPAAALDIEGIYMTSCKDHLDGTPYDYPWCFEIWIDLVDPGTLDHIHVTPPTGGSGPGSGPFIIYEDGDWWEYESPNDYLSLAALQAVYPPGDYTFEFHDSGHVPLNSVTLDYSGLSEPDNPVDFTYPSTNGQTGIDLDPTFEWLVDLSDGDALGMWLWDPVTYEDVYGDVPVSMNTLDWTPGSLEPSHDYHLEVSVFRVKDGQPGPTLPTTTGTDVGDTFEYALLIEYLNEIEFTTAPGTLSGLVWMAYESDFGYSSDENDLVYFLSFGPVWSYNSTTGWGTDGPAGWVYVNWPILYEFATESLWFALPPVSGLWVYHFSTNQWTVLPRITPW